ncbi:MAG: M20/M25/M40 family metallo-hydrolase [Halioglobus sp.]
MLFRALTLFVMLFTSPVHSQEPATAFSQELLETSLKLRQLAIGDPTGYQIVESLTTEVGARLAGSPAEARARDWAVEKLSSMGFENVRIEAFKVPLWQRGIESATVVAPFPQSLSITALGGSVSTGAEGVEGEIISFPSLLALSNAERAEVEGKIVFIDEVMTRTQDGSGYSVASLKRRETAYEAHRQGAIAALIRSVGTSNHRFPHAGQMHRVSDEEVIDSVPTAALSAPDADQLARIQDRGVPVIVNLVLETQIQPASFSGNVIAEIPGRERPDEIVLIGAHLDSWDLGTGAVDDGAGVGIVIAAAKLIMDSLAEAPKRTIRIVLFGSEEVGLVGAKAYAERHAEALKHHVVGTESDFGAGDIWRFDTRFGESAAATAMEFAAALKPLGIAPGNNAASGGPDMLFVREAGVPVVTLLQNGWDYFDLHHTPDDTLDKIGKSELDQNIAAFAVFTYLAAETDAYFR